MGDIQTKIEHVRGRYEVQILRNGFWNTVQFVYKRITAAQIVREIKLGNYKFRKPRLYGVASEGLHLYKSTKITVIDEVRDYFKRNPNALVLCKDIILDIGDDDKRVSSVMTNLIKNDEIRRIAKSPTMNSFHYGLPHMVPVGDFKHRVLEVLQEHPEGLNVRALLFHIKIHCPPRYRHSLKELLSEGLIKQMPDSKKTIYVLSN